MKSKIKVLYIILTTILCFIVMPNRTLAAIRCLYNTYSSITDGDGVSVKTYYAVYFEQDSDGDIKVYYMGMSATPVIPFGRNVMETSRWTKEKNFSSHKKENISAKDLKNVDNFPEEEYWDYNSDHDKAGKRPKGCTRIKRIYNDYKIINGKKMYTSCPKYANISSTSKISFYSWQSILAGCADAKNNTSDEKTFDDNYKNWYLAHSSTHYAFLVPKDECIAEEKNGCTTDYMEEKEEQEKKEQELGAKEFDKSCSYYKDDSSEILTTVYINEKNEFIEIQDEKEVSYPTGNKQEERWTSYTINPDVYDAFKTGNCLEKFYLAENDHYTTTKCDGKKCHKYILDNKKTVENTGSYEKNKSEFKIKEDTMANCKDLIGDDGLELINEVMKVIKIVVPILLLVFGIIDFLKATFAGSEDDMSKAKKSFIKRLIAAVIVFLTPTLINFLLGVANNAWSNIHAADCIK